MISENDHWLGVELRHLAALQAIAQEGSFRRAAERLGYTQSAVSQQIASLERLVGERLIDRPGGPRAVSLTGAGELLLRHADAILARVQAARADLEALAVGEGGTLRVGTYQSVSRRILPRLLRDFTAAWPKLELRLNEAANDTTLLPMIERGELDLSFTMLPLPPGPFESVEVLRDPYLLVVPADSPIAASGRRPELAEIADLPLIGFRECRSRVMVETHLHEVELEPEFVFRSDDNGTIQALVAAGMGSALVPRLTVEESDDRVRTFLVEEVPPRLIALAWHRDRYRSAAARAFIEATVAACRELAGPPVAEVALA
jgi:DNA-binding transcriptional LysR family regulator